MKFEGTLSPEEFDFILEVGLNWLMQQGALPMIVADEENPHQQVPPAEMEQ